MKRILFVDDEPRVLDGLRRMLRRMRDEWEMAFELDARSALEAMERQMFDIVVSDMKMPGMDGAELLAEVRRLHPETIRIILSGHSDREAVLKSVGISHQYLSKPCDPEELKRTIDRANTLRDLLDNDRLKGLVSQMTTIPSMPAMFQKIVEELQHPNASLQKIGEIVAQDIGMSAKILQLVNSAYFGLVKQLSSVGHAVAYLGLETINALVLSVHIFSQFDEKALNGFSMEKLWHHSLMTSNLARALASAEDLDKKAVDDAFMGGMLHDSGKLVLAGNMPDRYARVADRVNREEASCSDAEREEFGATHAEVGAYLMGLWGLPDTIVEAIAFHANPGSGAGDGMDVLTIVHVASALAGGSGGVKRRNGELALDRAHLERLGIADHLPAWRQVCTEIVERGDNP